MLDGPRAAPLVPRTRWTALGEARAEIDALNVYPVPDGDTGTNLYLTVESARRGAGRRARTTATSAADLRGAGPRRAARRPRQLRRDPQPAAARRRAGSLAEASGSTRPRVRGGAATAAAGRATRAVASPVEGTILTVARAAAEAAGAGAGSGAGRASSCARPPRAAHEALARTPTSSRCCAAAGVVDAGGRGLACVLDALVATVTGRRPGRAGAPAGARRRATVAARRPGTRARAVRRSR